MGEAQNLIRHLFSGTALIPKDERLPKFCALSRHLAHLTLLSALPCLGLPSAVSDLRIGCGFADSCDEAL